MIDLIFLQSGFVGGGFVVVVAVSFLLLFSGFFGEWGFVVVLVFV